jgi:hypothetical protein
MQVTKLCDLGVDDCVCSVGWAQRGTHLAVGTNNGKVQVRNYVINDLKGFQMSVFDGICGNCSLLYYFISALIFFLDFSCLFYFASIYCYSISQLSKRNICFR